MTAEVIDNLPGPDSVRRKIPRGALYCPECEGVLVVAGGEYRWKVWLHDLDCSCCGRQYVEEK